MVCYRQGDVLLVRVGGVIGPTVSVPREGGRLVLAHGEATGHAHVIEDVNAALVTREDAEGLYLLVYGDQATLEHDEHDPITLAAGTYRVVRQREYEPGNIVRQVAD
jgi:hypothetical protein